MLKTGIYEEFTKNSRMQNDEENVSRYRLFSNDVFLPIFAMSQKLRGLLKATKKSNRGESVEMKFHEWGILRIEILGTIPFFVFVFFFEI